jgi:hypothetical protein
MNKQGTEQRSKRRETNSYRFDKLKREGSVLVFVGKELADIKRLAKRNGLGLEINVPLSLGNDSDLREVRSYRLCSGCGKYPGDPNTCAGCDAYREHQA